MEKNEGIILLLEVQEALEHFFKNATNYSLINFLNFRAEAYDFTYNKRREHLLYKKSLEILAINDDLARTYLSDFAVQELEYIPVPGQLRDVLTTPDTRNHLKKYNNDKIEDIEADYELTVAAEVSQQMKTYIRSTTARITNRFSESASPSKRLSQVSKNQSQDELYDDDNFLDTRNIYPLCKPFKEFLKEDVEELFDVISNNTNVEFDLPENIKDYIEHLLSGDIEDAFSKVEKSVDNTDPLLLWTREICRHFLLYYYYFGGLQIKGNEKTCGENSNEAHIDRKNDAVLYQDKDATVLYEQSYGPTEFELPHQLNDFVKLAQNGVDDLKYHFAQHNNCSITTAKKFKSIGIHGYKEMSKENALKINNDRCIGDWIKIPDNTPTNK
ncbi:24200_t:CDS:2 [Gigaspora margarita]|uniref:24200_t:CDS:1 n=1 Tax=Gigaspora margarita TaxID=4874 RepID=A0ABM8VX81_GIGMA|nr:24200_t:CDS:2 [Gigaspora margarita]